MQVICQKVGNWALNYIKTTLSNVKNGGVANN